MSTCMNFVCDNCGCVDNLRMVRFSGRGELCSECETGEWHGMFEKEQYDPYRHVVYNRSNPGLDDGSEPSFS